MLSGKYLGGALLAFAAGVICYFFFVNYSEVRSLEVRSEEVKARIARTVHENAKLQNEAKALKEDMRYVDKVAREELGMVRKDEIVYHFGE